MFGVGLPELIVIFFVLLLLFGPKALPEIARAAGDAVRAFKREVNDLKTSVKETDQKDSGEQKKDNT